MKHRVFTGLVLLEILTLIFLFILSSANIEKRSSEITAKRAIVRELMLTDFAVWTEARYTRHPSQADLFTPFQDYPSSFEHFPAGSIIAPPENIKGFARTESKSK
jgi:hypothetical protein